MKLPSYYYIRRLQSAAQTAEILLPYRTTNTAATVLNDVKARPLQSSPCHVQEARKLRVMIRHNTSYRIIHAVISISRHIVRPQCPSVCPKARTTTVRTQLLCGTFSHPPQHRYAPKIPRLLTSNVTGRSAARATSGMGFSASTTSGFLSAFAESSLSAAAAAEPFHLAAQDSTGLEELCTEGRGLAAKPPRKAKRNAIGDFVAVRGNVEWEREGVEIESQSPSHEIRNHSVSLLCLQVHQPCCFIGANRTNRKMSRLVAESKAVLITPHVISFLNLKLVLFPAARPPSLCTTHHAPRTHVLRRGGGVVVE